MSSNATYIAVLSRFFVVSKAKVKNPEQLAKELAKRAQYLKSVALKQLEEEPTTGDLRDLYNAFKKVLVHDQDEEGFSDAFAQTITYGLLTARWIGNDQLVDKKERFTRETAQKYLPEANSFLKGFFEKILKANYNKRPRLLWLIEDIVSLLDRIDVKYVFDVANDDPDKTKDPVIHFYEPFLDAYDKDKKKERGVFFTPRPVVSYIVRSVHELLQTEFKLEDGLASTDTWGDVQERFKDLKLPEGVKPTDPFVCILDPATGTGTFLFECIEVIERTMKDRWRRELKNDIWKDRAIAKLWNEYVPKHLLPRLYGYELMMASYAVAHLKLSFKLAQTGYKLKETDPLNVYLTDSLEPHSNSTQEKIAGIFPALAQQAQQVNNVKCNKRFTVVIGNPPYAGELLTRNKWIPQLVNEYKFINGKSLGEKNSKWLKQDYVKFIRFGQFHITQTGIGILGLITNHGFLENPTFRGMRWSLKKIFNHICVLDLHGNLNKREKRPGGGLDENVFDIKLGVSILVFNKSPNSTSSLVKQADLWGERNEKYKILDRTSTKSTPFSPLNSDSPSYPFVPQTESLKDEFFGYMSLNEIMPDSNVGFVTSRDKFVIAYEESELIHRFSEFADKNVSDEYIQQHYPIGKLNVAKARKLFSERIEWQSRITKCLYRPFDKRAICYAEELLERSRSKIMNHLFGKENIALISARSNKSSVMDHFFCTRLIMETKCGEASTQSRIFPLYIYPSVETLLLEDNRRANFSENFVKCLSFTLATNNNKKFTEPTPEEIFYYIYAVFYSTNYRTRYIKFLQMDYPRLPLPKSLELFCVLGELGNQLVNLHLMESNKLNNLTTQFIDSKLTKIEEISYSNGTVWIDKKQTIGFKGVPEEVWSFCIGGYQVCKEWLGARGGRTLSQEDIEHYQKIIVALSETIRIMQEIDEEIDEHGGWPDAFANGFGGNENE